MSGFGTPNYNDSEYEKNFKPQSDKNGGITHSVFRILPPMKKQAAKGIWHLYIPQHFGYSGVNSFDPSKTIARPFRCLREKNFKTGMIIRDCPECIEIDRHKEELEVKSEEYDAKIETGEMTEADKELLLSPLREWLKSHNWDGKHRLQAMNREGELGKLSISNRTFKTLRQSMDEVRKEGIDPLALDQGVWFDIVRTGLGWSDADVVKVETEQRRFSDGTVGKVTKLAPIPQETAEKALAILRDLSDFVIELDEDHVRQLVESGGEPSVVDAIFDDFIKKANKEKSHEASSAPAPAAIPPPPPAPATVSTAETVAAPTSTGPTREEMLARIEALQTQLAGTAPNPTPTPEVPAAPPAPPAQTTPPAETASQPDFTAMLPEELEKFFEDN